MKILIMVGIASNLTINMAMEWSHLVKIFNTIREFQQQTMANYVALRSPVYIP